MINFGRIRYNKVDYATILSCDQKISHQYIVTTFCTYKLISCKHMVTNL